MKKNVLAALEAEVKKTKDVTKAIIVGIKAAKRWTLDGDKAISIKVALADAGFKIVRAPVKKIESAVSPEFEAKRRKAMEDAEFK